MLNMKCYFLCVCTVDKPVIQNCTSQSSGVEHLFTLSKLSCLADGNPPATVRWYHGGRQIDASTPLTRTQSGTFIMKANNTMGQTNVSIDITIECMYGSNDHISYCVNATCYCGVPSFVLIIIMHSSQMNLHLSVRVAMKLKRMMRTVICVNLVENQSLSLPGSKMGRRCTSHRQGVTVETTLSEQPTNTELQITRYMSTSYVSNYDD